MPHTHGTVNEVTRGSKAHQRRLMMTLTLTGTVFVAEIVGASSPDHWHCWWMPGICSRTCRC